MMMFSGFVLAPIFQGDSLRGEMKMQLIVVRAFRLSAVAHDPVSILDEKQTSDVSDRIIQSSVAIMLALEEIEPLAANPRATAATCRLSPRKRSGWHG